MTPYGDRKLGQHWLAAPNHYLNHCWLIISKVWWHSSEGNFTAGISAINHCNWLEKYPYKISLNYPRPQWVKLPLLIPQSWHHLTFLKQLLLICILGISGCNLLVPNVQMSCIDWRIGQQVVGTWSWPPRLNTLSNNCTSVCNIDMKPLNLCSCVGKQQAVLSLFVSTHSSCKHQRLYLFYQLTHVKWHSLTTRQWCHWDSRSNCNPRMNK